MKSLQAVPNCHLTSQSSAYIIDGSSQYTIHQRFTSHIIDGPSQYSIHYRWLLTIHYTSAVYIIRMMAQDTIHIYTYKIHNTECFALYIAFHCGTFHCSTFHCSTFHCSTFHYSIFHCSTLLFFGAFQCTPDYKALQCSTIYVVHFIEVHFITVHYCL